VQIFKIHVGDSLKIITSLLVVVVVVVVVAAVIVNRLEPILQHGLVMTSWIAFINKFVKAIFGMPNGRWYRNQLSTTVGHVAFHSRVEFFLKKKTNDVNTAGNDM